jgi:hypothetical protein
MPSEIFGVTSLACEFETDMVGLGCRLGPSPRRNLAACPCKRTSNTHRLARAGKCENIVLHMEQN